MKISVARDFNLFAQCMLIRTQVFVIEQGISANLETDEFENQSTHYLVTEKRNPVATCRWQMINNHTAKIERVAVLKQWRAKGIGSQLMHRVFDDITSYSAIDTIKVGSQTTVVPFYEKLGFQTIGEPYLEAGIPHQMMIKNVLQQTA